MLDHIHIQNYRLFKDLKIDKLGQVNLIAGKNNTGKTALLEALRILASRDTFIIFNIISSRGFISQDEDFFTSLFYNYEDKNQINIEASIKDGENSEIIFAIISQEKGRYFIEYNLLESIRTSNPNGFEAIFDGKKPTPIKDNIPSYQGQFFNENALIVNKNFIFIPIYCDKIDVYNLLWKNIPLSPKQKEVVKILKTIESRVTDVGIDNNIVKVLIEGEESSIPLKSLGDGSNRFFLFALALVKAKDSKLLLIDEFEVGIHHSVQEQLWDIIFKYAKEWNIQVFATTHSQDTVKAFTQVAENQEYTDMANYFRLQRKRNSDDIVAINYDVNELEIAIEQDIETR